jgi:hypothetical protein
LEPEFVKEKFRFLDSTLPTGADKLFARLVLTPN